MDCNTVRKQINDALSHSGPPKSDDPVMAHVKECELCRRFYEDAVLGHALAEMPVPAPGAKFAEQAIKKAVRRDGAARRKTFIGMSAAAAIILFGIVFTWQVSDLTGIKDAGMKSAGIEKEMSEKTVRVMIEAAEDRQNATLTVEVAESLTLKDHVSERRIEWQADLVKGKNLLELPVLIHNEGGGYVNIRYRYNGNEHEVHIPVSGEPKRT